GRGHKRRTPAAGAFWPNEAKRQREREQPTCGCGKRSPAPFHCFRIVIYNGWRNSNVSTGSSPGQRLSLWWAASNHSSSLSGAAPTNPKIRASRNRAAQSYVRLFPMPAPWTSLATLEQFASSATTIGRCAGARRPQLAASQGRHAPMARMTLDVNGKVQTIDADPDMPLLYALRNELSLNNPHFGCGLAQCG